MRVGLLIRALSWLCLESHVYQTNHGPELFSEPRILYQLGSEHRRQPGEIYSLSSTNKGEFFISGGASGLVQLWDLPKANSPRKLVGLTEDVIATCATRKGNLVAGSERVPRLGSLGPKLIIWNSESGKIFRNTLLI